MVCAIDKNCDEHMQFLVFVEGMGFCMATVNNSCIIEMGPLSSVACLNGHIFGYGYPISLIL